MANHRRNASQKLFASTELTRVRKQARRRNAVPSTKQAQRELAAQAAAEHPVTRIEPTIAEQVEAREKLQRQLDRIDWYGRR